MIYETKAGVRYWVDEFPSYSARNEWCVFRKLQGFDYTVLLRGSEYTFPTREAAVAALKSHADKHKWKEIEG